MNRRFLSTCSNRWPHDSGVYRFYSWYPPQFKCPFFCLHFSLLFHFCSPVCQKVQNMWSDDTQDADKCGQVSKNSAKQNQFLSPINYLLTCQKLSKTSKTPAFSSFLAESSSLPRLNPTPHKDSHHKTKSVKMKLTIP